MRSCYSLSSALYIHTEINMVSSEYSSDACRGERAGQKCGNDQCLEDPAGGGGNIEAATETPD